MLRKLPDFRCVFAVLAALIVSAPLCAEQTGESAQAHALLEELAAEMVESLQDPVVRRSEAQVSQLVERVLVPHINFELTSKLVLGKHWRKASGEQRQAFITEFKRFVLRFYTTALADYVASNEVPKDLMHFEPLAAAELERQLYVRSQVKQRSGQAVSVDYRVYWDNTAWKVVDVSVEGISMAVNYRTNFSREIRANGLDGLIDSLRERNLALDAG